MVSLKWRFQPKLTLLYSVLFLAIFLPVIAIVQAAVVNGVTRSVERELDASGAVFERLLALRGAQLEQNALVLSGDFGFRAAVATEDAATIESALFNIIDRIGASRGFVVDLDGRITASTDEWTGEPFDYFDQLDEAFAVSGAAVLNERPHILVSAPVRTPLIAGWVVFAMELDAAATTELEGLSPVQIQARIRHGAEAEFADQALGQIPEGGHHPVSSIEMDGESVLAHFVALPVMETSAPITLVLAHPRDVAFAPYRQMFWIIGGLGVAGMAILAGGSWFLSARVTRPLAALTRAVDRLKHGQRTAVHVDSHDEFADLADGFNTMSEDISAREGAMTHMALHDAETGLPNRRGLQDGLSSVLEQAERKAGTLLLGLRVKRFANVRAAIGYDLSADYLNCIAERLRRGEADVARLSLDTLVALVPREPAADLTVLAAELHRTLGVAVALDDVCVDVNATLALVEIGVTDEGADRLVQSLELALDHAEAEGLQSIVHDPERIQDPAENLSLMSDMRAALEAGGLQLHYQPKVETRSGRVTEVEALLRWIDPQRGFVPPDVFVEMAEETGHIIALSEWVVEQALLDQQRWAAAGLDLTIGINMSGRLLANASFTDFVIDAVRAGDADPGRVVLEITETAVMDDPATALVQLHRLRNAGVSLSIDDYGTGFSSLSYLKDLPVDELKIDKSFVMELASNEQDRVLVRSTIELARSLGLKVTAEGVEDAQTLTALQLFGCDYAQGYYISKAIPADTLQAFAHSWNKRAGSADADNPLLEARG